MPRERVTIPPQVSHTRPEGMGDTPPMNLDINPMSRESVSFWNALVTP
jgi:hypothetical protein